MTVLLLWVLVIYVTLVYAPIAAWLVELFPSRIRYSGLSLPYHIGNGWFGGFLPATVFAIVAATGNIYSGLWYPDRHRGHEPSRRPDLPAGNQGRRHQQDLKYAYRDKKLARQAGRGSLRGRLCIRLFNGAEKLQHDLAPMRPGAMFDQIDRLPRSER